MYSINNSNIYLLFSNHLREEVNAYESESVKFIRRDSSKTINEKSNDFKVVDNNLPYDTVVTFLVHRLISDATVWSNTLGESYGTNIVNQNSSFAYNPNSIIEVLRRR